jgi:hypothetical protein
MESNTTTKPALPTHPHASIETLHSQCAPYFGSYMQWRRYLGTVVGDGAQLESSVNESLPHLASRPKQRLQHPTDHFRLTSLWNRSPPTPHIDFGDSNTHIAGSIWPRETVQTVPSNPFENIRFWPLGSLSIFIYFLLTHVILYHQNTLYSPILYIPTYLPCYPFCIWPKWPLRLISLGGPSLRLRRGGCNRPSSVTLYFIYFDRFLVFLFQKHVLVCSRIC